MSENEILPKEILEYIQSCLLWNSTGNYGQRFTVSNTSYQNGNLVLQVRKGIGDASPFFFRINIEPCNKPYPDIYEE